MKPHSESIVKCVTRDLIRFQVSINIFASAKENDVLANSESVVEAAQILVDSGCSVGFYTGVDVRQFHDFRKETKKKRLLSWKKLFVFHDSYAHRRIRSTVRTKA